MKLDEVERGPIQRREKKKKKEEVKVVSNLCLNTVRTSALLAAQVWCSTLAVAFHWWQQRTDGNAKGSVIDLNTDSSYLLVSPGLETMVGSSKRSPQTPRGVRRDGGEGEGEGGGGWGGSCWHTPPLGDSVSCHWAPDEGTANKSCVKDHA